MILLLEDQSDTLLPIPNRLSSGWLLSQTLTSPSICSKVDRARDGLPLRRGPPLRADAASSSRRRPGPRGWARAGGNPSRRSLPQRYGVRCGFYPLQDKPVLIFSHFLLLPFSTLWKLPRESSSYDAALLAQVKFPWAEFIILLYIQWW